MRTLPQTVNALLQLKGIDKILWLKCVVSWVFGGVDCMHDGLCHFAWKLEFEMCFFGTFIILTDFVTV